MKFFEYIKEENKSTAKILGFPLLEQTSDYVTAEKTQKFLGRLVTTFKVTSPHNNCSHKEINVLGHSLIKRLEENNCRTYFLFNKIIRKISLLDTFKKRYFKYFGRHYDDIYILNANSGEVYLTLTYFIDSLMKKNGSKKPLLLATKKYHVDMIKMICPDIPYRYIKKFNLNIVGDTFKIDKFRFFLLYDSPHFKQVENDIKNNPLGKHYYFKSILNRLGLSMDELSMRKITVPFEDEQSMLEKVSKTGLNLNKFVFLAPEAQSCKLYDEDFWVTLINTLQENGCDVFVNLVDNTVKLEGALNFKTCRLSFAEAFALAKQAKKIVSLRSGLTEFLLQTNVPIDVLYTKFKHRHFFNDMDIYHVMSGFGISQIPFVDKEKIQEFNMFEMSSKECLEKIMELGFEIIQAEL